MILLNYVRNRVLHGAIIRRKSKLGDKNFPKDKNIEYRNPKGAREYRTRNKEYRITKYNFEIHHSIFLVQYSIGFPTVSAFASPFLLIFPTTDLPACCPLLWENRTASIARENG